MEQEALSTQQCEACRGDAPPVSEQEKQRLAEQIPQWTCHQVDGIDRLSREFSFDNFAQALAFTQRVGELAEQQGHHPAITTEWGKVTVSWWTHKIKALHRNDFVMAAKTDALHGA